MPVDYQNFHSSIPITSNSSEMELRNSISRNHYAILHYLIAYTKQEQIPDGVYATGTHQRIIDAISKHLEEKGEQKVRASLKAIFTDTKAKRTKADYFLDKDIQFWEANQVAGALERIKKLLEP